MSIDPSQRLAAEAFQQRQAMRERLELATLAQKLGEPVWAWIGPNVPLWQAVALSMNYRPVQQHELSEHVGTLSPEGHALHTPEQVLFRAERPEELEPKVLHVSLLPRLKGIGEFSRRLDIAAAWLGTSGPLHPVGGRLDPAEDAPVALAEFVQVAKRLAPEWQLPEGLLSAAGEMSRRLPRTATKRKHDDLHLVYQRIENEHPGIDSARAWTRIVELAQEAAESAKPDDSCLVKVAGDEIVYQSNGKANRLQHMKKETFQADWDRHVKKAARQK